MPKKRKWTLMFFLASDNLLAPSIVSQLKAIKDAGFHHDVNVIVQFDPYTEGTPTHIFDVNIVNKLKNPDRNLIGFNSANPFVRNLIEDKLWRNELNQKEEPIRLELQKHFKEKYQFAYEPPIPPDISRRKGLKPKGSKAKQQERARVKEPGPKESLKDFLGFCAESYPADHYMLFILGHGVVVGNDVFLYDEHAEFPTLTLIELGVELDTFKKSIDPKSTIELISFHSCSVSSLEVVCELEGFANHMLASQGPSFVGSWPYRQMLIRLFNDVGSREGVDVRQVLDNMFDYCRYNASDFLLAGYSYQLTLCELTGLNKTWEAIAELSKALRAGLDNSIAKDLIILAHWRSQSFYQEMYTDLADFCDCLNELCERQFPDGQVEPKEIKDIKTTCKTVMGLLSPEFEVEGNSRPMVIRNGFIGPSYQYSKGMSVYFPWSKPSDESEIMDEYLEYEFNKSGWLDFLNDYFEKTQRESILEGVALSAEETLKQDIANLISVGDGQDGSGTLDKTDPNDKTGGDCECPSIKNFPLDTRRRRSRRGLAGKIALGGLVGAGQWGQ